MKIHQSLFAASLLLALAGASGCSSDTTSDVVDNGKAVTGVDVNPDKNTLSKGETLQFHAVVRYADGTSSDVSDDPDTIWNTSDPDIATVSRTGLVTARGVGAVDISADYKGEKGNEHFIITP